VISFWNINMCTGMGCMDASISAASDNESNGISRHSFERGFKFSLNRAAINLLRPTNNAASSVSRNTIRPVPNTT